MKKYNNSVFIFTRDLRLVDNTSLNNALQMSDKVLPIFILTPEQLVKNKFKSNNCIQFMMESLTELNEDLLKKNSRLFLFYDKPKNCLENLLSEQKIDAVFMNIDYTPYAKARSDIYRNICQRYNVAFFEYEDYVLCSVKGVLKSDNTPYVKFTPYYNKAKKIKIQDIDKKKYNNFISGITSLKHEFKKNLNIFYEHNELVIKGGRKNALKILSKMSDFKDYKKTRDYPLLDTTRLSPYLKFNVVSIREVYHLASSNELIKQLYWRNFYMMIMYHFPHVIGNPMKIHYDIKWDNDNSLLNLWKEGKTGFPIVDAGMRQLNTIGWMHNRLRMITSNFLVKILHIDWRLGEKYFAQKLVDYDPANNNGGWQWSASTGSDSQPYFRIFNPWRQSEKFDKETLYIKKWIPELLNIPSKDIHKWYKTYLIYNNQTKYPKPIIEDLQKEIKKTLKMYKERT